VHQDALAIEAAHAVEIYNEGSAQWSDRGAGWYLCDQLLMHGRRVNAYAADDAHVISGRPTAFAAWVQVRAEELTPEALLTSLKTGAYYSSQGPEIGDIVIAGGEINISCSPAQAIIVSGPRAHALQARGEAITAASFVLEECEHACCRVTIIDHDGKRAWSNPIWLGS
jgi:hypothetical protein